MTSRWLPMGEAARSLGISRPTLRKHLRSGAVPGLVVFLGQTRIDKKVFESWWLGKDLGKKGKKGQS